MPEGVILLPYSIVGLGATWIHNMDLWRISNTRLTWSTSFPQHKFFQIRKEDELVYRFFGFQVVKVKSDEYLLCLKISLLILPQCKAVRCTAKACQILIFTAHISISVIGNHEKYEGERRHSATMQYILDPWTWNINLSFFNRPMLSLSGIYLKKPFVHFSAFYNQ